MGSYEGGLHGFKFRVFGPRFRLERLRSAQWLIGGYYNCLGLRVAVEGFLGSEVYIFTVVGSGGLEGLGF